jgi:signal transduction histidine kinase
MSNKHTNWTWIDTVFSGIRVLWLLLWVMIFVSNADFHDGMMMPFGGLLLWVFLAFLVPQFFLLPTNLSLPSYYAAELIFSGSLYGFLLLFVGSDSSLMLIPLISMGLYFSHRKIWWGVISTGLIIPILGLFFKSESVVVLLTHLLNNVIALGVGFSFNRMVVLLNENQEQKRVLEQYAKKVESLTLLEERNRMAGELHDTIGHTFTSVIVGIDGVIANLKRSDKERAESKLQILRDLTRKSLEDLRKNIHGMADEAEEIGSFIDKLAVLANEFSLNTGTKVSFQYFGLEHDLSNHAEHTLMRCLQEALTNAKRHGNAQTIDVKLEYKKEQVSLTILDDGKGTDTVQLGFGLNRMKQRLQALNGNLEIAAESGAGMELICTIPIQGELIDENHKVAHRG